MTHRTRPNRKRRPSLNDGKRRKRLKAIINWSWEFPLQALWPPRERRTVARKSTAIAPSTLWGMKWVGYLLRIQKFEDPSEFSWIHILSRGPTLVEDRRRRQIPDGHRSGKFASTSSSASAVFYLFPFLPVIQVPIAASIHRRVFHFNFSGHHCKFNQKLAPSILLIGWVIYSVLIVQ